MCPELWVRRFEISPDTRTSPICCSSRRLTWRVSSVTESTGRAPGTSNSSPKSHWLVTLRLMRGSDASFGGPGGAAPDTAPMTGLVAPLLHGQRFGNAFDPQGSARRNIDPDQRALQEHPAFGHIEALRHASAETPHDRFDL